MARSMTGTFRIAWKRLALRLLRDRAGNALGITAAAILMLVALAGSGTDAARAYMTRTSLQNACDAGVLAGRKAMSKTGTYGTTESAKADKMFAVNYNYLTTNSTPATFNSAANNLGQVTGTATSKMPLTIMRIFGFNDINLSVTCSAELQMASADVMFVLDTTGSMDYDVTNTTCCGQSDSKIVGLRNAVIEFYKTVAGAITDKEHTRIRFGFVPYSSTVNVKELVSSGAMPTSYLASTADYQTRRMSFSTPVTTYPADAPTTAPAVTETYSSNITQANCNNYGKNTYPSGSGGTPIPGGGPPPTATTSTAYAYLSWAKVSGSGTGALGTCKRTKTVTTTTYQTVTRYSFTNYIYSNASIDVSAFKGLGTVALNNQSSYSGVQLATSKTYDRRQLALLAGTSEVTAGTLSNTNYTWAGCIEERKTVPQLSMSPVPAGATDLDLTSAPTSDPDTQWKMYLEPLEWYRGANATSYVSANPSSSYKVQSAQCPVSMKQFTVVDTSNPTTAPSWLTNYVNSLTPKGSTYHDIGMIWAGRLAAPTGIFASNVTEDSTKYPSVSRHVIFMSDGTMDPSNTAYNAYGTEYYDHRIAPSSATDGQTGTLKDYHNNRFLAVCQKLKEMGYTVWVIGFGQTLTTPMKTCATSNRAYFASDTTQLTATFKYIAGQVADLRINK